MRINTFDIDGVINMGDYDGVYPGKNDIIITGRSFEERDETMELLSRKGIQNAVYMNPLRFSEKSRKSSGTFKGFMIQTLNSLGYEVMIHYEDDPIQAYEISFIVPEVKIVLLKHNLVEKENVRHLL